MAFPAVWKLLMSPKICNNTSNKGLGHYIFRKTVDFREMKNLKVRQKTFLLNDDIIILMTWLISKFWYLKMCCTKFQVIWVKFFYYCHFEIMASFWRLSSYKEPINSLYSNFSDAVQKALLLFKIQSSCLSGVGLTRMCN